MDGGNAKGYYRKGMAYLQFVNRDERDIKEGFMALESAYKISKDPGIYQEMVSIKKSIVQEREKEKKTFCFIMNPNKENTKNVEAQPKL